MDVTLVAIPSKPQRVWDVSSEKVPHLTILYLGSNVENLAHIEEFIEHATKSFRPFFLEVDRRGLLGDHDADVLFFNPKWAKKIETFRSQLLTDTDIFKAYHSVEQYPSWTPHLTLGYPESPAKPDPNEHGHLNYVEFDTIALWTGDYEGRVFPLETDSIEDVGHTALRGQQYLEHYGVKGMKWGVVRAREILDRPIFDRDRAEATVPGKVYKTLYKPSKDASGAAKYQARAKIGGVKNLSNEELRAVINRLALEAKYKELYGEKQWHTRGKRWAGKFMTDLLRNAAASWINNPFSRSGRGSSSDRSPISIQAWSNGQQIAGAIESGL